MIHQAPGNWFALVLAVLVPPSAGLAVQPSSPLREGSGDFMFVDQRGNKDKPIRVYYHAPKKYNASRPIVFVMHGVKRNADKYRGQWRDYAEKGNFLLIAPEFSRKYYPKGSNYERGNMFDSKGKPLGKSKWSFTAIEHLFDHLVKITGCRHKKYYIYGHSAGGQFVHRLVTFLPMARIYAAVSANSGWYTVPRFDRDFPYGLRKSPATKESLTKSFSQKLTIMVGDKDTDPNHKHLRRTPEAMEQGKQRLERGKHYYRAAREAARELKTPLRWGFKVVRGVAHSNSGMSRSAVRLFFPRIRISGKSKRRSGRVRGQ